MFNPYVLLIIGVALLGTHSYSFYKGHDWASSKCESAKWESQVRTLEFQLSNQKRATVTAEKERDTLRLRESELETVVQDYEKSFAKKPEQLGQKPEPVVACIDPRAARALRAIK